MQIWLRRVYLPPGENDGLRVLVDRLWPRGISKQEAAIDLWLKEVSPSNELRKWYGHELERWEEFRRRYIAELDVLDEPVKQLCRLLRQGRVTLVFGAKDEHHNNAVVIKEYLAHRCGTQN